MPLKTLYTHPDSLLHHIFFTPYQDVYEKANAILNIPANKENYFVFLDVVISTFFEGMKDGIKPLFEKNVMAEYQIKQKEIQKKYGKQERKENPFYLKQYRGNQELLQTMLQYIPEEEKNNFLTSTFMNDRYIETMHKINQGTRVYFLLKYLHKDAVEFEKTITNMMNTKNNLSILKELQEEYAASFHISFEEFLSWMNFYQNYSRSFINFKVFLGIDIYNLSEEIETDLNVYFKAATIIMNKYLTFKQTKQENHYIDKGIYLYYCLYPHEEVNYVAHHLSPSDTALLKKKFGDDLLELNNLSSKEAYNFQVFVHKRICNKLLEIQKEKKEIAKKELIDAKNNLYLVKERRKGISITELAQKYQIDISTICELFANSLFLFGNKKEEIINEINKLENYSWENCNPYQYMRKFQDKN